VLAIAGGIVLVIAAFLVPVGALIWWLVGCVLVPMVLGVAYSLVLARRTPRA
jgi:hypothetical protein